MFSNFQFLNASNLLCLDIASFNYNYMKKSKNGEKELFFIYNNLKKNLKSLIVVANYTRHVWISLSYRGYTYLVKRFHPC